MTNERDCIVIENAKIIFRNFSGIETKYNRQGSRNFCVIIEDEKVANELKSRVWNIKILPPREEGEEAVHYIQVAVSFDVIPPKVFLITRTCKTALDIDTINTLDYAEISNVDVEIRPYNWNANGKSGVKGYLKSMYVTIVEDAFAHKYEKYDSAQ